MATRDDRHNPRGRIRAPAGLSSRRAEDGKQGSLFHEPTWPELLRQYEDLWLNVMDNKRSRSSLGSVLAAADDWVRQQKLERPTAADWKRYLDWRRSPDCPDRLCASTVEGHRKVLQRVYLQCRNTPQPDWLGVPNPLAKTLIGRYHDGSRDRPRSMATPHATYPRLLEAMPDVFSKALVSTLRWTAIRIGEALAIPVPGSEADRELGGKLLDLDAGTLRIEKQRNHRESYHQKLKTQYSPRVLRLWPETLSLLREALRVRRERDLHRDADWVRRNRTCTRNYLFPYFYPGLERLMEIHRQVSPDDFKRRLVGVDGGDAWHVYRHTWTTTSFQSGVKLEKIHEQLGHRSWETTQGYMRALRLQVVEDDTLEESYRRQMEQQAQATAERSGKGLLLVKKREET